MCLYSDSQSVKEVRKLELSELRAHELCHKNGCYST